jgi:hypothetical protein
MSKLKIYAVIVLTTVLAGAAIAAPGRGGGGRGGGGAAPHARGALTLAAAGLRISAVAPGSAVAECVLAARLVSAADRALPAGPRYRDLRRGPASAGRARLLPMAIRAGPPPAQPH